MSSEQRDNLITAKQVAEKLGVRVSWVYSRTRSGKLPHYKLGKYRRYIGEEVFEALRVQQKNTDSSSLL